jgi:hypothetical protein
MHYDRILRWVLASWRGCSAGHRGRATGTAGSPAIAIVHTIARLDIASACRVDELRREVSVNGAGEQGEAPEPGYMEPVAALKEPGARAAVIAELKNVVQRVRRCGSGPIPRLRLSPP